MWQPTKLVLVIVTCYCVFFINLCHAEVTTVSTNSEKSRNSLTVKELDENVRPISAFSVREDAVKAVNQRKDIIDVVPVETNITQSRETVGVNQAKDVSDLVPVIVNDTKVKEVFTIDDRAKVVNVTVPPPLVVIEEKVQPISDIPSVDLRVKFDSIGTAFCREKSLCNSTVSSRTCSCDRVCGVLNDCCEDADVEHDANLALNQFSCSYISGLSDEGEGVMVVSKCATFWNDDVTKNLCEQAAIADDIFSQIPVSDLTPSGFVYKNRNCAHCNNVYQYEYWRATVRCLEDTAGLDITDRRTCDISYMMPGDFSAFRKCNGYSNVISECSKSNTAEKVREKCIDGFYSTVHVYSGEKYRNKNCAMCNDVAETDMYCEPQRFLLKEQSIIPPKLYNFRMIVDFNSKWVVQNEQMKKLFTDCRDNEIYDPFTKSCREIFCPPSALPSQGKCVPREIQNFTFTSTISNVVTNVSKNDTRLTSIENCTLTKINHDEFEFLNGSNGIIIRKIIFNETEYLKNGSNMLVCAEKLNINSEIPINNSYVITLYNVNEIESYVTLAGLIVSIIASLITMFVYILFPQLLNVPGKNLICLIISLIVSQTLFLLAAVVSEMPSACITFAILMHYSFLCAFCWMNVIAFDLWVTFSQKFISQRHQIRRQKRFHFYSLYGWCLPLVIVCVAISLNYANLNGADAESFRPNYGHAVCWITSKNALLVFLVGPLAFFKLFDFVFFGFTAYHIFEAKQQGVFARRKTTSSSFLINLRLSLVMGLTWIFAFVANFTNSSVMWYLFIICNTLQGLFIALSFLCTRRVMKLFREKYRSSSSTAPETQMTVSPGSKSIE